MAVKGKSNTHRKLTAILCADVVGYSRLMGDDEESTIETLTAYRKVFTSEIKNHRGRGGQLWGGSQAWCGLFPGQAERRTPICVAVPTVQKSLSMRPGCVSTAAATSPLR